MTRRDPRNGTRNHSTPTTNVMATWMNAIAVNGSSLPSRYSLRAIGVTKSCSSVPRSRSLTIDWLMTFDVDIRRMNASSAGTIVLTARIVGLYSTRTWASTPIGDFAPGAAPGTA